ncbi:MAG: hypothetical protein PVG49_09995 [Desulfobacteraceae bacterium]|jgi:hypothetical protein
MSESKQTLLVRADVELTPEALQAIVYNAKEIAGPDEKGVYRVDTADKVGEMISKFLLEKDFEAYVRDIANYPR